MDGSAVLLIGCLFAVSFVFVASYVQAHRAVDGRRATSNGSDDQRRRVIEASSSTAAPSPLAPPLAPASADNENNIDLSRRKAL
jgi:hypothetical protein